MALSGFFGGRVGVFDREGSLSESILMTSRTGVLDGDRVSLPVGVDVASW